MADPWWQRPRRWLAGDRAVLLAVVAALVVVLPALFQGMHADDHIHRGYLLKEPQFLRIIKPPLELFTFYDGDPGRTGWVIDRGITPWWTSPHVRVAFFRPLSALTHAADYALWPESPLLMHAHSIVWYAALVAVAAVLYRRVLGASFVAGLAALVYGIDHTHGLPVAWVANRNALVAGFFSLAAIVAYDAARRSKRAALGAASALLFGLGLAAGESGLAALGYLIAYAAFLDAAPLGERIKSLLPHAAVAIGWATIYRLGHYGVVGSGMYYEPLRQPADFAGQIAANLPLLVAAELGGPTPDLFTFIPLGGKIVFLAIAMGVILWSSVAVVRLLRRDARARFFLVGAVLALLPGCATFPAARLLIVPSFGLVGLVARVGAGVLDGEEWVPARGVGRRLTRSFAAWACGAHLVLSPLVMQIGLVQMSLFGRILGRLERGVPDEPSITDKRLVVVNPPDMAFVAYLLVNRYAAGRPAPERLLSLAPGVRAMRVTRADDRTLLVRVEEGFYRRGTELLGRRLDDPMPVGTRVRLTGATIEIVRTDAAGVPLEATFRFDAPLESAPVVFLEWDGRTLVPFEPPPVGESVDLPGRTPDLR
jgi:hypothetical protein